MKACPFCAEEIQDAAVVCPHCGRDLVTTNTPPRVQIVQVRHSNQWAGVVAWTLLIGVVLAVVGGVAGGVQSILAPACAVTAASDPLRRAGETWCESGWFTAVELTTGGEAASVLLRLSDDGETRWSLDAPGVTRRLSEIADTLVNDTNLNASVALFNSAGLMVSGCVRGRTDTSSKCGR